MPTDLIFVALGEELKAPIYVKSRNFSIHLLGAWWIFWLVVSCTGLNEFIQPSSQALLQFVLLVGSFLLGFFLISSRNKQRGGARFRGVELHGRSCSPPLRVALRGAALACAAVLVISLYLSGAFGVSYAEYFIKLRQSASEEWVCTGIYSLDLLTKMLIFPLSYAVLLIVIANGVRQLRLTLLISIFNFLAFSYLWQVNYPLIHLFWFLIFYELTRSYRLGSFDLSVVAVLIVLFSILLASSVNRYGLEGEVIASFQRYLFGYHLIGFSFYDYQYTDPKSLLHVHSLGRSSIGYLDQVLQVLSKMIGGGYNSASLENSAYNIQGIDIGRYDVRECNAFGTILFSFYRDFNIPGIIIGGFAYGAIVTHALYRSHQNWIWGAIFMLLASSWMMGMMVSPLEQPYFWFTISILVLSSLSSRILVLARRSHSQSASNQK